MKIVLTAAILALTPLASFAMCQGHETTAQTCASGYQWDTEKGSCVETVTG